jgi:hypothetical protein
MKMELGFKKETFADWKGKWIYLGDEHNFWNVFRRFRKDFILPKNRIKTAIINITGDTRYKLWVNGKFVCRGPAKGYPWSQPYDTVDIKDYLKEGENCLTVLLHVFGVSTFSNVWRARGGVLIDGEVAFTNACSIRLDSDETWKAVFEPARSPEGQRLSLQQSFQEIFDARKDIPDWIEPGFNCKNWRKAKVMGPAGIPPWHEMEERDMPLLKEELVPFTDVTRYYEGKNHPDWKNNHRLREILYEEKRKTIPGGKIRVCGQKNKEIKSLAVYPQKPQKFSAILLDLGKSSVGSPALEIEAAGGEYIDFFYTMRHPSDKYFYFKPGQYCDIALLDRYICRKGKQDFEPFHFKGYRDRKSVV